MRGKIHAISISKRKGIPKSNIESAKLIYEHGIENDAHAGKWHRQVSLLAVESINKMRIKLPNLRAGAFAENITTEGIDLSKLTVGDKIKVGDNAELEITQLGKVCHDKCAIYFRVGNCVMPAEGIFARVIIPGNININDDITLL
jgi:MOSC domain-containing protein YiiM